MNIEQLERDMTDRFKASDDTIRRLNNQLQLLEAIIVEAIAQNIKIGAGFIRELGNKTEQDKPPTVVTYPRSSYTEEPAKQVSDIDFAKQRIEKLEDSESDLMGTIEDLRSEIKKLLRQNDILKKHNSELQVDKDQLRSKIENR